MTIEEKANEYVVDNIHVHNRGLEGILKSNSKKAFIAGAEWMQSNGKLIPLFYDKMLLDTKQELIDKAVIWLKNNVDNYCHGLCTDFHLYEFIVDFKRAIGG